MQTISWQGKRGKKKKKYDAGIALQKEGGEKPIIRG